MNAVNLRIGHLVIDGLGIEARDGPRLRAAIETELARLLGQGGEWGGSHLLPVLGGEPLPAPDPRPEGLGAQIGAAIHASLPR